jgi:DoxX-like protein
MNSAQNRRETGQAISRRGAALGSRLINFSVFVMIAGAILKTLHPAKVVAYMGSMGYPGAVLFLIAALELLSGILFLLPATRAYGLLLVSAYFGGAISAHLAHHPPVVGGPFLTYMSMHPYAGSLFPSFVLACAWAGIWLRHPEMLAARKAEIGETKPSHGSNTGTAVFARS